MNRIILIGNGFDLAHGLKTSYRDFIDWFWKREIEIFNKLYQVKNPLLSKPTYENKNIVVSDINWFQNATFYSKTILSGYESFLSLIKNGHFRGEFAFKNQFLKIITEKIALQNWVDIEEEYYSELKNILHDRNSM